MPRSVKIDDATYEWLQRHKELTGVPIQRTIKNSVISYLNIGTVTDKLLQPDTSNWLLRKEQLD